VIKPTNEVLHELDKIRKCFLWADDKAISGGKCKVKWTRTTLPKEYGGLGVLDLEKFARALRLRWLWQQWTAPDKAWAGMEVPCDEADRLLFANYTHITLGDDNKTSFWNSGWLQGSRPKDVVPLLFAQTRKKKRTVASAIHNDNRIRDINLHAGFTKEHLLQFTTLWNLVAPTVLHPQHTAEITRTLTQNGEYSTASAYKAQFMEYTTTPDLASLRSKQSFHFGYQRARSVWRAFQCACK
jgi:hypothetical protein